MTLPDGSPILFAGITPVQIVEVREGQSLQAAVDAIAPGIKIVFWGQHPPVDLKRKSGTPTAPYVLEGMPGSKIVGPAGFTGSAVNGWRCSNWTVRNVVGSNCYRGIYFAGDEATRIANVLIQGCFLSDMQEDGVKIAHADNVHVLGNRIMRWCLRKTSTGGTSFAEAVDFVNVRGGLIAYNEAWDAATTSNALSAKMNSSDVDIIGNHIHHVRVGDGIAAGGQGASAAPASITHQLLRGRVALNLVEFISQCAVQMNGAVETVVEDNCLAADPSYYYAIHVTSGKYNDVPVYSKNVVIRDNAMIGNLKIVIDGPNNTGIKSNNIERPWSHVVGPAGLDTQAPPPEPTPTAELEKRIAALEAELAATKELLTAARAEIAATKLAFDAERLERIKAEAVIKLSKAERRAVDEYVLP